eukprot:5368705-Prymnesium_polylepis.1
MGDRNGRWPELHGGERVAARRPGTVRRCLGRSGAGFEPRRLPMPRISHKSVHSPRARRQVDFH